MSAPLRTSNSYPSTSILRKPILVNLKESNVTIATIQSFVKLDPEWYCDLYNIVVIDEAHHLTSVEGQYGKVLSKMLSPMRIALSATPTTNKLKRLTLEGFTGPLIAELSIQKGIMK